jgi:hypothetical protein
MFHELCGYLFCCPPTAIDNFDSFNILELVDFLLTAAFSGTYVWHDFGTALALNRDAKVRLSKLKYGVAESGAQALADEDD